MKTVVKNFKIEGVVEDVVRYGEGHINETYLVTIKDSNIQYILQKINNRIFPDINGLMNNIELVTTHLKNKIIANGGDYLRETLNIIKTNDDKSYYHDETGYYRLYLFVSDSLTLQNADTKELFKESAIGFGKFVNLLADFDATKLVEVIPNFHNTLKRFEHFMETLSKDPLNRAKDCKEEIEFVLKRKEDVSIIVNLIKENKIPLKVTHNDTKLNNVLLDNNTKKALCVIDLDTIMPGSSLYDFGDSIRFGCNSASEDEKDLSKVTFLVDYFKAYVEGYLGEVKNSLNEYEIKYLPLGAKMMTLECGIRFLDDYLDGDHYFRTHRENHNLDRCRTQFKLVSEIEKNMDLLNKIVEEIVNK